MTSDDRISVLEHLNKIMDLRFGAKDTEFDNYKNEIERRLEGLNNLWDDVEKDRGLLVRGETYYPKIKAIEEALDTVEKRISAVETSIITTAASTRNWLYGLGAAIVAVEFVLRFWK